ncbi:MAG: hypothetical protein KF729_04145 [Sandaracinaceae bacterium]|nr:hypothetical protein [Sandaracinaceae bacterium]
MRSVAGATGALALLAACASPDPSAGTCARRAACGDLEGLTEAECEDGERARLARLAGEPRARCADALGACLDGASCDDFRACHAAIGRAACPCPDPSVVIVSPRDGQPITRADDVAPEDDLIQLDFVIDSVCLERDERVLLVLLEPVHTTYGDRAPDARGRAVFPRMPLFPGTNRFIARGMTTEVESAPVTLVSP